MALRAASIGALVAIISLFVYQCSPARAQHDHELFHAQYQNWNSTTGYGCCNDKDCGPLPDARVRENGGRIEVMVLDTRGDQWCPIEEKHLVDQSRGKRPSPDWSMDHACILSQDFGNVTTACERLKCFMEKGKF